jgi:hypothetical protein
MRQLFATNITTSHAVLDDAKALDLQSKTGRAMRPAAPTPPRRGFFGGPRPVRPTIFPIGRVMRPAAPTPHRRGFFGGPRPVRPTVDFQDAYRSSAMSRGSIYQATRWR